MLPKAICEYLELHRDGHLARLFELLRIPSIANEAGGHGCNTCAGWLARHLEDLGLDAHVVPTAGRPNVLASLHVREEAPTLLVYGHYDVQPPEPLEAWKSNPFEPEVREGCIYARGAADDKGQLFAHLMAIEAWQRAGGGLPVNIKLLIEGEEEIGSPDLEPFIAANAGRLAADAVVISDSEFFADGVPSITYGLRGLAYVELTLRGPSTDVHSGLHGGALANPVNALAKMVAALHDDNGRITIPGFYDDVLELTQAEQRSWDQLLFDEARYAASLGVGALSGGEKGYSVLERRWGRPTLDCNGIVGGYTGPGSKTIIPAQVQTKISMRLVPRQDPQKVVAGLREFVAENTPPGMKASLEVYASVRPVLLERDSPAMNAAQAALEEAFGRRPAFIRSGASIPVTELVQRILGLDAVMMGWGLPDDNLHAPNERFRVNHLWRGSLCAAAFLRNLRDTWKST